MLNRYEHNGLTWVDLESPTRDEIVRTTAEFSLDPLVAEELLLPSAKPRAEFAPGYLYTIMHFPALRHSHKTKTQEIDFIVGKNFIVTVHYDTIDPLHKFSKLFEVNSILDKSALGEHAGYLFFYLVKKLYRAVEHELEYVRHELESVENHIFSGEEVAMVSAISRSSRDLLNIRQTIEPHRDMLQELEAGGVQFFGEDFRQYLRALSNEYYRVHNHLMRSAESLRELRETNDSLLSTKQNETMRILTIMSLLTFPLVLIVALLSADISGNPLRTAHNGFLIIALSVFMGALAMLSFFRYKKWL